MHKKKTNWRILVVVVKWRHRAIVLLSFQDSVCGKRRFECSTLCQRYPYQCSRYLVNMEITFTSQRTSKRVVDWACIIGFGSRINRPAVLYPIFALLRWNWSRYFHLFVSVFGSVLTSISFGTVVSVSIERYIALCLHLRYEDVVTVKRARNFLITLWLIGGTLPFIWVWLTRKYRSHFFFTGILLCLLISSVAYIKIYRIIRYHRRQIISTEMNARNHEKITQRKRNTFNMFVVHCVLLLCFLPYSICLLAVKSYGYTNCSWIAINFALLFSMGF